MRRVGRGVLTLAQPGTYTLLLEGATTFNTGTAGTYTINVQPAPINAAPLILGDRVNDAIGIAGEQDRYTFTLGGVVAALFRFADQQQQSHLDAGRADRHGGQQPHA